MSILTRHLIRRCSAGRLRLVRSNSKRQIQIYNSLTESVEPLSDNRGRGSSGQDVITWYSCGPTVYDDIHLGHASCYIRQDSIRRVIERFQEKPVVYALGVTDVDDKIIRRAKYLDKTEKEVATQYEHQFFNALEQLNVRSPDVVIRVSDNIPKIIKFIQSLIDKQHAYVSKSGNVFFDVQTYPGAGKFDPILKNKNGRENREKFAERSPTKFHPEKRNRSDFALWKAKIDDEVSWPAPWGGEGRPGWHIECSSFCDVITSGHPYLTIHSGGVDLKFPHHNNELCQSEAYYCTDNWVGHFVHIGSLVTGDTGEKMSKSLGNFISVEDYLTNHGTPDELRISCLRRDYKSSLVYSRDDLSHSRIFLKNVAEALAVCENNLSSPDLEYADSFYSVVEECSQKFERVLCSDFNFPSALDVLSNFCSKLIATRSLRISDAAVSKQFLLSSLDTLGVELTSERSVSANEKALLAELNRFRSAVRDIALGKNLQKDGIKLSKTELKEIAARNSDFLDECDRVRSYVNSLSLRNYRDE